MYNYSEGVVAKSLFTVESNSARHRYINWNVISIGRSSTCGEAVARRSPTDLAFMSQRANTNRETFTFVHLPTILLMLVTCMHQV